MTDAIENNDFSVAGENDGEAESWDVAYQCAEPGWANFSDNGALMPVEKFSWFGLQAKIIGAIGGPFNLVTQGLHIDYIDESNDAFVVYGCDFRKILPPGSWLKAVTASGNDCVGGYWQVERVQFYGGNSTVYVTENVQVTGSTSVALVVPPTVFCDVDGYGWGARSYCNSNFPLATPIPVGATAQVMIDRGTFQTVTFPGGETTASAVAAVFDAQLSGASCGVDGKDIYIESDTLGRNSSVYVDPGTTGLVFPVTEDVGYGQICQLWDFYFEDINNATAEEIADAFLAYWKHCRVLFSENSLQSLVEVIAEHRGPSGTVQISGPAGELQSNATWPISARGPSNNTLEFQLSYGTNVTVTLDNGVTSGEDVAIAITAALGYYFPDTRAVFDAGQVHITSFVAIKCTGGTANTDIAFLEDVHSLGSDAAIVMGFSYQAQTGQAGEYYSDWSAVTYLTSLFGGGGDAELFAWGRTFETIEKAGVLASEFANWISEYGTTTIDSIVQNQNKFVLSGDEDKTLVFPGGSKLTVINSTGNDGEYTVDAAVYESGSTSIYIAGQIPSAVADGAIIPVAWDVESDDFEESWDSGFVDGWISPRLGNGQLIGEPISFPFTIPDNRNDFYFVLNGSDVYSFEMLASEYNKISTLILVLNNRLNGLGITDLRFGYIDNGDDTYCVTFGHSSSCSTARYEIWVGVRNSRRMGDDLRGMIGFAGLSSNGSDKFIVYPRAIFDEIDGSSPSEKDLTDEDAILIDAYSRCIFRRTLDAGTGENIILENDEAPGVFNEFAGGVTNSYAELFILGGWGGDHIEVTLSPDVPEGTPVFSNFGYFTTGGPTVVYENFEIGW